MKRSGRKAQGAGTEDLQVAREGSAAFLIMLEGFLRSSPDSIPLMQAGVTLNGAYATAFVEDPERESRFAEQRLDTRLASLGTAIERVED